VAGAQFIGKQRVIEAFEKFGGAWALVQGKKVCASGEGSTELAEWLDIFAAAESRSPYTLHLYGDMDPEEITTSTKPLRSWDVMIHDTRGAVSEPVAATGAVGAAARIQKHLDDKIAEKFDLILEKLEEPEESQGIDFVAIAKDYAENPHKMGQVMGAVQSIIGILQNLFGMNRANPAPAAMGSVYGYPPQQETTQPAANGVTMRASDEAKYNRLAAVLDRLEAKDPKLIEHLEKLADIAEKDSFTFSMILSRLDAL
jgi:hypothetical protein